MSRLFRIFLLGGRSLLLHPLRSFLTALGIIIGVGTVIYMLAVIEGRAELAQERIRARGATNIIIQSRKPSEEGQGGQSRSRVVTYGITFDDAQAIRANLPGVDVVAEVREVNESIYFEGNRVDTVAKGTMPWYPDVSRSTLAQGRWFTDVEFRASAAVVVLGPKLARQLFTYRDPMGERVRMGSKIFEVIGVLDSALSSDEAEALIRDRAAYIPMRSVRERFGDRNIKRSSGVVEMEEVELHRLLVRVKTTEDVIPTSLAIEELFAANHKKQDYQIEIPLKLLREAQEKAREDRRLFGAIAAISLLVGGIGIMNIMLASVTERTREIGVRRALGAKRRFITIQFLVETLILSVVGGLIGIGGGFAAMALHTTVVPEDPEPIVTLISVVLAFGISGLVGIVAGLYPAIRAAHMHPIEARRHS